MLRRLLLTGAGFAAVAIGNPSELRAQPTPLAFDAASIKPFVNSGGGGRVGGARGGGGGGGLGGLQISPGRVFGRALTVRRMVMAAYSLKIYQSSGGPGWLDSDRFDLEAKSGAPANEAQLRHMLQTLLAERCQLAVHKETKEMAVYGLTKGKNWPGPNLHAWKEGEPEPKPTPTLGLTTIAGNFVDRSTMDGLADTLSGFRPYVGRPVLNQTGAQGTYFYYAQWDADENFMTELEEQLGLKFVAQKAPIDILVIDRVEKPSGN
jgi:uncharacterized protein (TIGR03435 family)